MSRVVTHIVEVGSRCRAGFVIPTLASAAALGVLTYVQLTEPGARVDAPPGGGLPALETRARTGSPEAGAHLGSPRVLDQPSMIVYIVASAVEQVRLQNALLESDNPSLSVVLVSAPSADGIYAVILSDLATHAPQVKVIDLRGPSSLPAE